MQFRRGVASVVALAVVASMTLVGISGVASAAPTKLKVVVSPNPLILTGESEIHAIVEVESNIGGATVSISSPGLVLACTGGAYFSQNSGTTPSVSFGQGVPATVTTDADGNATVTVDAWDCPAGSYGFEADLTATPFTTAHATLKVLGPKTTHQGLIGYPKNEVETGNATLTGSNVYTVFLVEMPAVYAETDVAIASPELQSRCQSGYEWEAGNSGNPPTTSTSGGIATMLDNDGNAVFVFEGISCSPGPSLVSALLEGGTHIMVTTVYKILAPKKIVI